MDLLMAIEAKGTKENEALESSEWCAKKNRQLWADGENLPSWAR
jgi:hypothetical protein